MYSTFQRLSGALLLASATWLGLAACSDEASEQDVRAQGTVAWETRGGRADVKEGTNYLSDLEISYGYNGWGPLERDMSNGEAEAGDGGTLTIGGKTYQKGLGMHPAEGGRTWAEAGYVLAGQCDTFSADVGLDDEIDSQLEHGSAVFQVFADEKKLWQSRVLTGQDNTLSTGELDVSGARKLKLVVTNADDNNWYDHANWGDAKVSCKATDETPTPRPRTQTSKKLIEYGWDVPTAEYVRDNIRTMEERPFEGLAFRIGKRDYISVAFDAERWSEADMQLDVLRDIEWNTFTDNFLAVWANTDARWFDDTHWATVTHNMRLLSKALSAADAKGILFDPEYYGQGDCHPWRYGTYDEKYDKPACDFSGHSLDAVEAKVRQRGGEFIDALESDVDDLNVISLHFMHGLYNQERWADTPVQKNKYALYRAFAEGMMEAADAKTRLVEGNETAYYWSDTRHYSSVYSEIAEDVQSLFTAPEYAQLYADKVDAAFAANTDCVFSTPSFAAQFPGCDQKLSEANKGRWFEQNIYNALLHSDEYVWLYSESGAHPGGYDTQNRMDWWSGPPQHVPSGAEVAIRRAKDKLEQNRALGFNVGRKTEHFADTSVPAEVMRTPQLSLAVSAGQSTATVEVTAGRASSVQLYLNSVLVAERDAEGNNAPFTFALDTLPSGQHTLFARGFSADGSHNTSNPVVLEVP